MMAVWTREEWSERAAAELGGLIAGDHAGILSDLAAGIAQLWRVEGDGYHGRVVLRFHERRSDGLMECHVLAVRGENIRAALVDLRRLCAGNGMAAIVCRAKGKAQQRLYQMIGFQEDTRTFRIDLVNA